MQMKSTATSTQMISMAMSLSTTALPRRTDRAAMLRRMTRTLMALTPTRLAGRMLRLRASTWTATGSMMSSTAASKTGIRSAARRMRTAGMRPLVKMVRLTGRMLQKEILQTDRMLRQAVPERTLRLNPELRQAHTERILRLSPELWQVQTGRIQLTVQQLQMKRMLWKT